MIAHTIRTAITVNIVLTSLSESAHYMDRIVYTAMSFLCRKTTSHRGLPTPVRALTALLGFCDATIAPDRVWPVSLLVKFLTSFRELEDPCAVFALNVLCHLKQLPLFFRGEAPEFTQKDGVSSNHKEDTPSKAQLLEKTPKPTTVSGYYLSQRVYF